MLGESLMVTPVVMASGAGIPLWRLSRADYAEKLFALQG